MASSVKSTVMAGFKLACELFAFVCCVPVVELRCTCT